MAKTTQVSFEETGPRATRIGEIFGVEGEDLEARMKELAEAALEEYELALSGERFPSTIKELRELRLRLLYEHLPPGLPKDEQIAELFQMTHTQVATLIAGTRARFGSKIEGRIHEEVASVLENAKKIDTDVVRIYAPNSLARYMNEVIARTHAPRMEKRQEASQTYYVRRASIIELCRAVGKPNTIVKVLEWED